MAKKTLIFCVLVAAVTGFVVFSFASEKYFKHIHSIYAQFSFPKNLSAYRGLFLESFKKKVNSKILVTTTPGYRLKNESNSGGSVKDTSGLRAMNGSYHKNSSSITRQSQPTRENNVENSETITPPSRPTNDQNSRKATKTTQQSTSTTESSSKTSVTITTEVLKAHHVTIPVKAKPGIGHLEELRKLGFESINLHDFKSTYIIEPIIYDNAAIHKAPGKRKLKTISCFNCPSWFNTQSTYVAHNRDFRKCPYSECRFDPTGIRQKIADLVLFFPITRKRPFRPQGQLWTYCSWESPVHYGYPSPYSEWKDVFNWTMSFRQDADIFAPNNIFAWRAKENLMSDEEYLKIAKSKTKTAAWFVSNCKTQSRREEYVERMKKIIDIDVYGSCTHRRCDRQGCLKMLNSTYKFYLSFENSLCTDYVTEKLFRNFNHRLQVIPVARGGFDYQKYVPPNMIVDASQFDSPEALAEYLKELADDLPRYTAMLKEKDKLTVLNYKYDWCELCERLHKGVKPKIYKDIKQVTHRPGVCWPPKL